MTTVDILNNARPHKVTRKIRWLVIKNLGELDGQNPQFPSIDEIFGLPKRPFFSYHFLKTIDDLKAL